MWLEASLLFYLPARSLATLADKGFIDAILGHQLFMGAPLDDFAVVDDEDLVGGNRRGFAGLDRGIGFGAREVHRRGRSWYTPDFIELVRDRSRIAKSRASRTLVVRRER